MRIYQPVAPHNPGIFRGISNVYNNPESRITRNLPHLVGSLLFNEIAVPYHRRTFSDLSAYRLVPIMPTIPHKSSMETSGHQNKTYKDVRTTYPVGGPEGLPYIDTRQAIGLARNNRLLSVASAGIATTGSTTLRIVQLQNVSGVGHKQPEEYRDLFVRDGVDWKKTLVRAWEEVGKSLDVDQISIQSHQNNTIHKHCPEEDKTKLDDLAKQMRYSQDPIGNDWYKPISDIETTPRKSIGLREHIGAAMLALR